MQKKITIPLLILSAIVLSQCFTPGPVYAQAEGFKETFDDPSLPGWEKSPQATVTDGTLQMEPGGFALHFGDWSGITMTIKVRMSGGGEAVVNYNVREANRYGVSLAEGRLRLDKEQDGALTTLGEASVEAIRPDTWITIKVAVVEGQHLVYVDDTLQMTASDPDPLDPGAILLQVMGEGTAAFDDLDLTGSPGGPPPGGEEPPAGQPPVEEPPPPGEEIPAGEAGQPAGIPVDTAQPLTKKGLIDELFASQANTLELTTFLINLVMAAVCAYILGIVYIHWGTSLTNRRKFAANFMLMTVTTTFIILVVRSSVALSLGLVGALSIVRFRTAVKEPEELAYLFFAIGLGIGLGDNQRLITMVALAAGIAILGLRRLFRHSDADVNLHLSVASQGPEKIDIDQIGAALRPHTSKMKLLRFDENEQTIEAAYLIEFRHMDDLSRARAALKALSGSLEITFMDNKGIW